MRKTIAFLLCLFALTTQGQIFQKVDLNKICQTEPGDVKLVGFSPNGKYLLTTTGTNQGLKRVDVASGNVSTLTKANGAGFQPAIDAEGNKIAYRQISLGEDNLRQTEVKLLDVSKKISTRLQKPSRSVGGYGFCKESPYVVNENKLLFSSQNISAKALKKSDPIVSVDEDLQLLVTLNGELVRLSPNGTDKTYIWPSLSPDKTKILYYVGDQGAYICNLDGTGVQKIHVDCRAPQWYDNQTIIGMDDKDDGEVLLSSSIVAYTLDGKFQKLSAPSLNLMYPFCHKTTGTIACSAANGELYLLQVEK